MRVLFIFFVACATAISTYSQLPPAPLGLSAESQAKIEIGKMKRADQAIQKQAMFALHALGKDAIGPLIEEIDDASFFSPVALVNPILSSVNQDSFKPGFKGQLFAYAIELILGRKALRGKKADPMFLVDEFDCVYGRGLIRKNGNLLTKKDLPVLKEAYRKWWSAHQHLPLDELRKEWTANKRPLTGSEFKWY